MNEILEMINKINAKKAEIKEFVNKNELDKAKAAKEELVNLDKEFKEMVNKAEKDNILDGIDNDTINTIVAKAKSGQGLDGTGGVVNNIKKIHGAFINAIKARITGKALNEEDIEILNSMNEGTDTEGGLLVPQDIQTKVKELRRSTNNLENLVNVEPVTTNSGSRNIEVDAESVPFDNVDEEADFPDTDEPKFKKITYKIKKKGGILKVTKELLEDTAENILAYLVKWITKKSVATRNALVLKKLDEITTGKEKELTSLDNVKDIFNVELDPAFETTAVCVTNQQGYNWLDKLKDANGNYILQRSPSESTKKLLFGQYPVYKLSKKTLKSKGFTADGSEAGKDDTVAKYKHPFYFGDLKEAVTIFDRQKMTIDINDKADSLWGKDLTGIKVRERLDIQTVDEEAVVKGYVEESV